jgi:hypothetical protein
MRGLIGGFALLGWVAAGGVATAQPVPDGSYRRSCTDIQIGGSVLYAQCRDRAGDYQASRLRFDQCRGDIANDDGRLTCSGATSGPGRPTGGPPPSGSYQRSCTGAVMVGPVLGADCRTVRGDFVGSRLDVRPCTGDIANIDGRLVCPGGGGGGRGPFPPPAGRDSLTLYDRFGLRGRSYEVPDARFNLKGEGFNDVARSIRIEGRGRWQICSDAKYRGRCEIIDRDVYDLSRIGMADVISSVRRIN